MSKIIMSKGKTVATKPVDVRSGDNYNIARAGAGNLTKHFGVPDRGMKCGGHVKDMLGSKADK